MQVSLSRLCTLLLSGILFSSGASASEPAADSLDLDPKQVLAYKSGVSLSQQEIDAVFSKLPEGERLAFIRDGAKVDQLINSLLQRKLIAREAVSAGFDQDPLIAARLDLEKEKELAEAWIQQVMADVPPADFEALAYEHYLAYPNAYRSEEVLDVSHILLGTESRSDSEARELASSLRAQLEQDPDRFDSFVMEYSDDPVKENNKGRYADMRRGMMVPQFEKAAFGLQQPGEISQPVRTEYGHHIIRLNGRSGNDLQKYETVKDEAVERARLRYYETYRQNYMRKLLSGPVVIPEGAVELMAKRYFGENLELAPEVPK
jgi:peptidyl-prolyl cis-trans isomerase C